MFGADDEEGRIVNVLSFERYDHAAQRLIGLLQPISEDSGRSARAIRVAAGLPVKVVSAVQLPSDLSFSSFCPTLTAWKFIPNSAGTPGPGVPSCFSPLISLRIP